MKVLSVDDSTIMRKIIAQAVEVLGADYLEAGDGREALDVVEAQNGEIDLIILDWNMPVMDGITTLRTLKADERFAHIPVLMVTTEAERQKVVEAIQAGARHYLIKPFIQEDLLTKMVECLGMAV